jgi:hypothetical protein
MIWATLEPALWTEGGLWLALLISRCADNLYGEMCVANCVRLRNCIPFAGLFQPRHCGGSGSGNVWRRIEFIVSEVFSWATSTNVSTICVWRGDN